MYFDHAATSPMSKKTREALFRALSAPYANANAQHSLGLKTQRALEDVSDNIARHLNIKDKQSLIFTSGATEANNLVLKSMAQRFPKGHLIISPLEHASVRNTVSYLQSTGIKVSIAKINEHGEIDLDDLVKCIKPETFLVSICACDSELGILQDVNLIARTLKEKAPHVKFHTDMTQSILKTHMPNESVDFISFSGHKLGSMVGIGALINNTDIKLRPLIHGGHSLHFSRSGTIPYELLLSLSVALDHFEYDDSKQRQQKQRIINSLKYHPTIKINSPHNSSPCILNISILHKKSVFSQRYLSRKNIHVSLQSACENTDSSLLIKNLYHNEKRAQSSIRLSFYHHTEHEITYLIQQIKELIQ